MSAYKLHYLPTIIIRHNVDGSESQVPVDPANGDYQTYLDWKNAGNTPDLADPAPLPSPQETADLATLADLNTTYQGLIDGLDAIQATRALLDQHAATLSTITVTSFAQVQAALRALGTDLETMIANNDKLASGSEKVLVALRALKRNLGR